MLSLATDPQPRDDPRDQLLEHGSQTLSDAQLLSILLRNGLAAPDAQQLAWGVLAQHGGLAGLVGLSPFDLYRDGLRQAKAASILAAVELASRLCRRDVVLRDRLGRPASQLARYLTLRYSLRDQEVVGALYVDCHHRILAESELYRGSITRTFVEPRQALKEALSLGAHGLYLFHTHPSRDPAPSPHDFAFTRRMNEAAELVGVCLFDHIVLGGLGHWVSLRERGAL